MSDNIQLAQGGGGRLSRDLIDREIVKRFGDGPLSGLPDAASLPPIRNRLIFTTDSFVVQPLEFPGGNIGDLAVHGTVNDIAVSGGLPKWLSLALILEEGLPLATLRKVLDSVRRAADDCGVTVATGDTKVVARGQCDGMYINTSGIGEAIAGFDLDPRRIKAGDIVLTSGTLGDHGAAVLSVRGGIDIENGPTSDTAPVHRLVLAAQASAADVRFMRDPTRGGTAAILNESVAGRDCGILLHEESIPLSAGTRSVCEMLGLDPLHVASEGRVLLFCAPDAAKGLLKSWRAMPEGRGAAAIGIVTDQPKGHVSIQTVTGGCRLVDVPSGELLPRIC